MDTRVRDNTIARAQILLKITMVWAILSSLAVIVLASTNFHLYRHKQVHWLPMCSSSEFSLSNADYSASYLKEIAKKVMFLRFTYNPETIQSRFNDLVHLMPAHEQEKFKKSLDNEVKIVTKKNISSVFYEEAIAIDEKHAEVKFKGTLQRTSYGLEIKPQHKTYLLTFSYKNGVLWPFAIKEVSNEK